MSTSFKYTNVTQEDIVREITDRLSRDPRFDNYRESAIIQQLVEIFAGTVDISNYYLQRRAEECFFDTAQLRSSVILLARQLGYVVQRPIPATANLKIKLTGDFTTTIFHPTKIQIPYFSVFTYEGFSYILNNTISIQITEDMIADMNLNVAAYESAFIDVDMDGNNIKVSQGEIKEQVIEGINNPQVSQKFQLYKIEDTEFSNLYGDQDNSPATTRVWVGDSKDREYKIDRRSLVNWENFSTTNSENNLLCLMRSAITEDIELVFGDAKFAAIGASISASGPQTTFDNIYIQYLATKGSSANKTGVIGKKIDFSGQIFVDNGSSTSNITDQVNFYFKTNAIGGADMEDIDSIRVNAPNIYYSLDRIVTSKDYTNFLKTLTSPIVISNAIAWGEQEECRVQNVIAIQKLFNLVLYSCVGDLYQTSNSPYYARTKDKDLDLAVLDYNFDENEITQRNYYNVYVKQDSITQLREYQSNLLHYLLIGNPTTKDRVYFRTQYGYFPSFDFVYTSRFNNSLVTSGTTITLDITGLESQPTDALAFENYALQMQQQFVQIQDNRGNINTNVNFGQLAFPGITVTYNAGIFSIISDPNDYCYIQSLQSDFSNDLGFSALNAVGTYQTVTGKIATGIIQVIDALRERSQITVQNIYMSPIIQNFNIKGKVYVDPLADKESLRVTIADSIYKWLNINADFNKLIYKSNIIQIVEDYSEVKFANIYFEPEILTATTSGGTFYNNGNNPYLDQLGTSKSIAVGIINMCLGDIIRSNNMSTDPYANILNVSAYTNPVQVYNFSWNTDFNERKFYTNFVNSVYNSLIAYTGTDTDMIAIASFANSNDFMNEMSLIHKDLLKIIRFNMLDTSGNIATENDSNGNFLKGGYSLGNEIVKMNVQLIYEYKV